MFKPTTVFILLQQCHAYTLPKTPLRHHATRRTSLALRSTAESMEFDRIEMPDGDQGVLDKLQQFSTLPTEMALPPMTPTIPTPPLEPSPVVIEIPSIQKILSYTLPAIGVWLCGPILSMIDTAAVGVLSGTAQQAALNPAVSVTDYGALVVVSLLAIILSALLVYVSMTISRMKIMNSPSNIES